MSKELHAKAHLDILTHAANYTHESVATENRKLMNARMMSDVAEPHQIHPWAFSDGVAAMGIGHKIVNGLHTDEIALKLYVENKKPKKSLEHIIPKIINTPGLPPVHTDVVEIGKVELQSYTTRIRPAIPGYSIGRAAEPREAGTFGMVVTRKGEAEPYYLLSNSHAIAGSGFATKGDAIIQPGRADKGTAASDTIGKLTEWIPFDYDPKRYPNTVDAAIAELDKDVASAAIAKLGIPKGVNTNLKRGDYVQKVGRTSELSVARVEDIDLRIPSTYPDGSGKLTRVGFSDMVLVTYYSSGGDSGSGVLDMDNNVVGLHVAGSPTVGVFCKIANVMQQLDVEVVTQ